MSNHVICHINLSRGYRGGERQTELLVRWLAGEGVSQRLIGRRGEPLLANLADVPGLERIGATAPYSRSLLYCRAAIVHAHEARAAKLAFLAKFFLASPYVITRRIGKRPGSNVLTRTVYRKADALVGVAASVAGTIAQYSGRQDVATIYSALSELPVDPARSQAIRDEFAGRFLVVNVAALVDSQKGQSHLIRVARRLQSARPAMQFVLLGEGRDRARFEAEAQGLSNLRLAGFVDNVGDYLAAADAFVLPSRHEGIGGACLDAMRFGLPAVASAVDGLPEFMTDGVNGLLVPPADEQALFDALCRLHDDPALAARLASNGATTAQTFSVARMGMAYRAIYDQIAAGSHRPGST